MFPLLIFIFIISPGESLNKFLKHFEPLNYEITETNGASRSANERINLTFQAYGREFKLLLDRVHEKDSIFLENATVEDGNETSKLEWKSNVYNGIVEDDERSHVFGSIDRGMFEGMIRLSNGKEYWMESSLPYNPTAPFHSFIYSTHDVDMSSHSSRWQRSSPLPPHPFRHPRGVNNRLPYEYCVDDIHGTNVIPKGGRRTNDPRLSSNRICAVFITIDHTLYEWMSIQSDHMGTRQKLEAAISKLFTQVNAIYKTIDFGGIRGINFMIAGYKIWRDKEEAFYPFKGETTDPQEFLKLHSMQDHSQYCLSYVFTYRDFQIQEGSAIHGLAYSCYLCIHRMRDNGGRLLSYNTGLITFKANGNEDPRSRWHLTLAHELGHSLGSEHDDKLDENGKEEYVKYPECKSNDEGEFIMYPYATDGHKPNNHRFSPCSIRNITNNLRRLLLLTSRANRPKALQANCLLAPDTPICGNRVIEKGEQCDCGYDEQECLDSGDKCCNAANSRNGNGCKLKNPSGCSPSQGPCCDGNTCEFIEAGKQCSSANDCKSISKCTGGSAVCPEGRKRNEGLPCEEASGICSNGDCTGTICAAEGLEPCETSDKTCMQYCLVEGVCTSTARLRPFSEKKYSQAGRRGHRGVMKKHNEFCRNGLGYCDGDDICRDIVEKNVISQGKSDSKFHTFGELLAEKWWIFIIISILAVIILVVTALICHYKKPKLSLRSPRERKKKKVKTDSKIVNADGKAVGVAGKSKHKLKKAKKAKKARKTKKAKAKSAATATGVSTVETQSNATQSTAVKSGK